MRLLLENMPTSQTYSLLILQNLAESSHCTSSWSFGANHTFSAKEKDTETGFSYFGSRYYSSDLSIWLSVDPMSDKYASLSPYTYCANNPIKLMDPNGEEVIINDQKNITMSEMLINTDPPKDIKNTSSFSEKLEKLEAKTHKVEVACAEGLAASLPISSTVNDIKILKDGEDIFGNQATKSDKTWAKVSLATLGVGSVVKLVGKLGKVSLRTIGRVFDKAGALLNARSGISTATKGLEEDEDLQKK